MRPPVVERILPHFGDRYQSTQVMLSGQRLGLEGLDIISVTIGGQHCDFTQLHASADSDAVLYCRVPPAKPDAPHPAIYDVIVTTRSGGIGTCEQRFTYITPTAPQQDESSSSSSHSLPPAPPPIATNPPRPAKRQQIQLKKCTVYLQSMLDANGYVKFSRMVPDDTHPRVHQALIEILEQQIQAAKDRFLARVAVDPSKDHDEPVHLVRCISVDNIAQQAKGYPSRVHSRFLLSLIVLVV